MSSYLTSPFTLEERRLQGIVDQCSHDFYCALLEVEEQERKIEREQKAQKERDQNYYTAKEEAVCSRGEQLRKSAAEDRQKKIALEKRLKSIQAEIEAFSKVYEGMEAARERQRRLVLQLQNTVEDFEEIERSIMEHEAEIQKEIKAASEERAGTFLQSSPLERKVERAGIKGVSLQVKREKGASHVQDATLSVFERKLKWAMESPYAGQIASLKMLKEQYEGEKEYAKTAFAVKHTGQLDEMIGQLEAFSDLERRNLEKRNQVVRQYKAICRLLEIPVDEKLLSDEKAERLLERTYRELYKKYEERRREQYIADSITSVMEKYGILCQNSDIDCEDDRMHFGMEDASLDVSGIDGDRLIMEVSGEYAGEEPTLNERRKSVQAAGRFCSLLAEIEAELKHEYGIIFEQVLTEEPEEETIKMRRKKKAAVNRNMVGKKEKSV